MVWRDGLPYAEVGKTFNVSRERIRQIAEKALRKLSNPIRAKEYAAVPYKLYARERAAHLKAEERLDWFLMHGEYRVALPAQNVAPNPALNTAPNIDPSDIPYVSPSVPPIGTDIPLTVMDLSVRAFNCLSGEGFKTLADILNLPEQEFFHIPHMGEKSAREILTKVHSMGYRMAWERNPGDTAGDAPDNTPNDVPGDQTSGDAPDNVPSRTNIPLESMGLSVWARNCLSKAGHKTLWDVIHIPSKKEFFSIYNLGAKIGGEIIEKVHSLGHKMAWETDSATT